MLRTIAAALLRIALPRDRAAAVLGDLVEDAERRRSGSIRTHLWVLTHAIALTLAAIGRSVPRAVRIASDDGRQVWRRLRSRPGPAVLAAAMLAAAIGVSTGTFAVLDSLVIERAPFADADDLRVVVISRRRATGNPELINLMRAWRDAGTFAAVEAAGDVPIGEGTAPISETAALVTPGLFDMLGVRPIRGRVFTEDEARHSGGIEPVLISARLWRSALGGDETLLGSIVSVYGREYRLVGIMPDAFRFPEPTTVLWRPVSFGQTPFPVAAAERAYVRIPAAVPESDVMRQANYLAGLADSRFVAQPNELASWRVGGAIDEHAGRALPLFAGAVGLIFLSLCANASCLRLAQMTARRGELGVRLSLGASRWRLRRELTFEHVAIGIAGTAGGVAVATALTRLAPQFLSDAFLLPLTLNPIDVDARALFVAAALALVALFFAGLLPAWIATRVDATLASRRVDRTHTESRVMRAMTRALLTAQVAFASMLLVGAFLLVRSFGAMALADRGMNADGVQTMNVFMSSVASSVLDDVDARVSALPGVEDAIVSTAAPPDGNSTFTMRWGTDVVTGVEVPLRRYDVRADFFPFFGITLIKGRHFRPDDGGDLVIVSERVAALLWPGADPVGRIMRAEGQPVQLQVVGVAREVTIPTLNDHYELPEIYLPHTGRRTAMTIAWRCDGMCPNRQQVTEQLRAADPRVEILHLRSTEEKYARELVRPRAVAELGVSFAAIGFVTSGAGLFAVFSYAVSRRRREFGIRSALGATPARLRRGVLSEAVRITVAGVAVGGLGAWALNRALAAVVYGVSPWDPAAWLAMLVVIMTTTLIACYRPSRQAAHVDPVRLLRED